MQSIAGIEPAHDGSRGSSEAGVKGVIHAFIPETYPPGNVVFIFMDDVDGSIRRTPIDDDIFEIRVALINDGEDSFLNVANSVIYRGGERDARPSRRFFLGE